MQTGNFTKVLQHASNVGFRFIAVNRRGYPGSTPFTEDELAIGHSSDLASQSSFLRARGLEIGELLVYLIDTLALPPIIDEGHGGGISVMGWSLGNITTMAFLRFFPEYP